ncbi:hypothetical protein O3G_MSEX002909, partial [Manduca sexta]
MSAYQKMVQLSSYVTVLNIIKLWRLACFQYLHTEHFRIIVWPFKLYCVILEIFILYGSYDSFTIPFFLNTVQYICISLHSLKTGDEYLYKYILAANTNDVIVGRRTPVFDKEIRFAIIFLIISRFITICISTSKFHSIFLCVQIVILSTRLTGLVLIIIFLMLYVRMKYLRRRFERNTIPVNIIHKNGVVSKTREMRKCLIYYNNLLDNFSDIDQELQIL